MDWSSDTISLKFNTFHAARQHLSYQIAPPTKVVKTILAISSTVNPTIVLQSLLKVSALRQWRQYVAMIQSLNYNPLYARAC